MLKNSKYSYGWLSILFHWLTAITVVGLFAVGWWMVELTYYSEWYRLAPHYHKSVGLTLAALTLLRLCWKWAHPVPSPLGSTAQRRAAKLGHAVIYLLLFALFISGYLISTADGRGIDVFNWFTVPAAGEFIENQEDVAGAWHKWIAYSLIGLTVMHAAAALWHHFYVKDVTLKRMIIPQPPQED